MCHVAGRIFFPGPGIEPTLVALEVPNLNLWTREVLTLPFSYMANLSASNLMIPGTVFGDLCILSHFQ